MTPPEEDRPAAAARDALEDAPTAGLLEPGAPGQAARMRPGLVLAERYMVMRFLAQGGMGEIYEVEDLQLRERVALKTIRAGHAGDPHALERFKREIQLARRVTHKNVCRIFEFGVHHGRDGPAIAFLTMELLPGETLFERLRREGRLAPQHALPLVQQMAAGLDAAHRAGIVHRDFKSANVVLTPGPDGQRPVVTDFGLAQVASLQAGSERVTDQISGTLDYMAPEQIEGQEPTPAVDLYALGVVMYEMVTGVRPFGGGPRATGGPIPRPDRRAPSPRIHVPDLDPLWESVILRCLEQDPSRRFRDAAEVARALSGEPARRRRVLKLAAAAGALMLVLASAYRSLVPSTAGPPARRSVAVLPFKNLSGQAESAWLATALSEMLTTELSAGHKLRLVPGEDVARMRVELKLPETDTLAKATLLRIQANLGTDLVVLGSFLTGASELRLDVRVQDARAGETLATLMETGARDDVLALVTRAGARLREALGLSGLTPAQTGELRAALPKNPEAARSYAAGLARLRAFDVLAGRDLLEKATAADPGYSLAHAALAEAWALLGYDQKASESAKRAFELSAGLPREERLAVEGRYREASAERDKAVEIYRVLFGFFPDDLEHGLRLAQALRAAGKGDQALETIASLRRLEPPAPEDPRIDLVEAEVAQWLGDFRRQLEAARRAATHGEARGARLLIARAKVLEAYAAGRLGVEEQAKQAAEVARAIYGEAGDRGGLAWALNRAGNVLYQQGRLVEASRLYDESLQLFEGIGFRGGAVSVTNNISSILAAQGDLARALQLLEDVKKMSRETGDRRSLAIAQVNVCEILLEMGRLPEARRALEEAGASVASLGERSLEAAVHRDKGALLKASGELAEAKLAYQESIKGFRQVGNTRYVASGLHGLGEVLREQQDLAGARAAHQQALALRQQLGDKVGTAQSQTVLAGLATAAGQPEQAEPAAREAARLFAEERVRDGEAEALAALASALHAQGRSDEARAPRARAEEILRRSENAATRRAVTAQLARLKHAPDNRAR